MVLGIVGIMTEAISCGLGREFREARIDTRIPLVWCTAKFSSLTCIG